VKRGGVIDGGDDRWGPAVREREGEGWVGSARAGWAGWSPGVGPVGLLASFFYFFPSAFLFFYSGFLFGVLKSFSYSDLNKVEADHFWSLKRVFRTL
jgi:hypothetical protein